MSGARAMPAKPAASGGRRRKKLAGCPICARPARARFAPFCSRHCADVDLGRWLGGTYVIPGREPAGPGPDDGPDDDPEGG